MRRPPVHLPSSSESTKQDQSSSSKTNESETDPSSTNVPHHVDQGDSNSSEHCSNTSKPPLPAHPHHFARPKLGHLPPSSTSSTTTTQGAPPRPPVPTNTASQQYLQQQQKQLYTSSSNNHHQQQQPPPMPSSSVFARGSNPFPQFTRGGGSDAHNNNDSGASSSSMPASIMQPNASNKNNKNNNNNNTNAAFEFYLNLPVSTTSNDNDNQKQEDGAETTTKQQHVNNDKFFVRLWGPKYLFDDQTNTGDDNAGEIISRITSPTFHHRLIVFLHGAGMSGMCFHLVACAMLGIDASKGFTRIDENAKVLLNNSAHNDPTTTKPPQQQDRESASSSSTNANNTMKQDTPQPICIAFDYRCHGQTKMSDENAPQDLDSYALDVTRVVSRMLEIGSNFKKQKLLLQSPASSTSSSPDLFWAPDQSVCLIGHSCGGSVACAVSEIPQWRQKLFGLVLLDIVEGTALESIRHMPDFLKRRPRSFSSQEEAVNWFVRQGGMRTHESAQLSVPTLIRETTEEEKKELLGASLTTTSATTTTTTTRKFVPQPNYVWITDLAKTEPFWNTWFRGMDARFLHAICPRMLCLSSRDTMDKDLTVAHMQGQFQLEIFRDCGHYLMEDQPAMVASVLTKFIQRIEKQNEKLKAVYMKKFGGSAPTSSSSSSGSTTMSVFPGSQQGVIGPASGTIGTAQSTIPPFYFGGKK